MKLAGSRKNWCRFVVAGLLTIHAGLLAYSASVHSPTLNEPGHLVAGISYWQFGRFDVYKVNPPLSRLVAALPVLSAGCKTDWTQYYDGPGARPEMSLGEAFVHANGERSIWLFTIARWACIPFSLIGGYVVFRWSRELYGAAAGILSLALWCFCPNILAHGSLITPDMSATAIGVAALLPVLALAAPAELVADDLMRNRTWRRGASQNDAALVLFHLAGDLAYLSLARLAKNARARLAARTRHVGRLRDCFDLRAQSRLWLSRGVSRRWENIASSAIRWERRMRTANTVRQWQSLRQFMACGNPRAAAQKLRRGN